MNELGAGKVSLIGRMRGHQQKDDRDNGNRNGI